MPSSHTSAHDFEPGVPRWKNITRAFTAVVWWSRSYGSWCNLQDNQKGGQINFLWGDLGHSLCCLASLNSFLSPKPTSASFLTIPWAIKCNIITYLSNELTSLFFFKQRILCGKVEGWYHPGILCSVIVESGLGKASIKPVSKGESIWKQNESV